MVGSKNICCLAMLLSLAPVGANCSGLSAYIRLDVRFSRALSLLFMGLTIIFLSFNCSLLTGYDVLVLPLTEENEGDWILVVQLQCWLDCKVTDLVANEFECL